MEGQLAFMAMLDIHKWHMSEDLERLKKKRTGQYKSLLSSVHSGIQ